MQTVLVTGATGFIGQWLCTALRAGGASLRMVIRDPHATPPDMSGSDTVIRTGAQGITDWRPLTQGVDCIVHLAARTHVMRETVRDPLAEYRRVNVDLTRDLALAAVAGGTRRFVFLSSIKVSGEATTSAPYSEQDAPRPEDDYGRTKWEAEQALNAVAAASSLETVILRPPLVYGPGVKGNFLRLMRAVARGVPLPLAAIHNKRSLIYLGNLVDAITLCVRHPAAAGRTYLLADEAVSTPDLVRGIGVALGKPARLLPLPTSMLKLAGALAGKADAITRLTGSLEIDGGRIRSELGWRPHCAMPQGLRATAEWYYSRRMLIKTL